MKPFVENSKGVSYTKFEAVSFRAQVDVCLLCDCLLQLISLRSVTGSSRHKLFRESAGSCE